MQGLLARIEEDPVLAEEVGPSWGVLQNPAPRENRFKTNKQGKKKSTNLSKSKQTITKTVIQKQTDKQTNKNKPWQKCRGLPAFIEKNKQTNKQSKQASKQPNKKN